jgi:hypothetical protein
VIRIDIPDQTTTDRLIEALYVAAGAREGTLQATQWLRLARQVETALDELPNRPPSPETENAA